MSLPVKSTSFSVLADSAGHPSAEPDTTQTTTAGRTYPPRNPETETQSPDPTFDSSTQTPGEAR